LRRPQVDRFAAAVPVPRDDPHLDLFHVVLTKIVAEYVDPIAPDPLVDAAITGLAKPGVDRNDATARAFTPLGAPIGDGVQPDLVLPEADTAPRTDVRVVERAAALLDGVR